MSNKLRDMFIDFDDIFYPTEEQIENNRKHKHRIEQMHIENLEIRESLIFVSKKDGSILYHSKPFEGFVGDCESCSHYIDSNIGFVTGGWCRLHNGISCGYGFTCKNNDSKYALPLERYED